MVQNDGIWIDMNEVSNFCNLDGTGQVCNIPSNKAKSGKDEDCIRNCCLSCHTVDATNPLDFPQYHINNIYGHLSTRTLAMSNLHYGNISVYNTHNLYGLSEQIASNRAMSQIRGKRAFVLSRSSFLSTGVHSAKWTGDNCKRL
jgi:alpha-glucosidase (family GH31 glycosyl hydrolase)